MKAGAFLHIPRSIWTEMQAEAVQKSPEEACGLLAGRDDLVERCYAIPNEFHSATRFRMYAQDQVRALIDMDERHLDLLAIWHSHPSGPPYPSPTDIAEITYPGVIYFIWFPHQPDSGDLLETWEARGFRIDGGVVCEVNVKVE
ncbi:MAG: M67 family metallopeptidase [Anaerolineaceae bacterium]|nr:M67 family metallopeptidase [Anaerolineaceae bacterium]